jgi:phage I-like protein
MTHVFGQPIVVLARKLKAKKEFRLFKIGPNPSTKGTYRLSRDSAMRLMELYRGRGLKITFDYDHAAVQKDMRPGDGKAAGKCDLELRADGIYCVNIEYTPTALKGVEEGEWIYFSPAFIPNEETKEIEELINVALTNIPALDGIEALAASRKNDKESTAMKHPISAHLQKFVSGGGKLDDVAKGTGIHVDRMKELHDGMGDSPAGEELKAMAKHMKFTPAQCKELSVPEPYTDDKGKEETASAMDGQDVEDMEGEGDDDEDEVAPAKASRRGTEAIQLMTLLTGTADPKKQKAKILAMRSKAEQYDSDHETVVALRAEREAEKRARLIEKGKAEGKLTPSSLKYWSKRPCDEIEEFLKVAPRVLATRSGSAEQVEHDDRNLETLTREDLEAARIFGVSPENFAKAKADAIGNPAAGTDMNVLMAMQMSKQRQKVIEGYVQLDSEGYNPEKHGRQN